MNQAKELVGSGNGMIEALIDRRWRRPAWMALVAFNVELTVDAYIGGIVTGSVGEPPS
jgi:hypothetical protein